MKQTLQTIAMLYKGIAYNDLTTLEKEILAKVLLALNQTLKLDVFGEIKMDITIG